MFSTKRMRVKLCEKIIFLFFSLGTRKRVPTFTVDGLKFYVTKFTSFFSFGGKNHICAGIFSVWKKDSEGMPIHTEVAFIHPNALKVSKRLKEFIIYHELGHKKLGHLNLSLFDGCFCDNIEKEYEADAYALRRMGLNERDGYSILLEYSHYFSKLEDRKEIMKRAVYLTNKHEGD